MQEALTDSYSSEIHRLQGLIFFFAFVEFTKGRQSCRGQYILHVGDKPAERGAVQRGAVVHRGERVQVVTWISQMRLRQTSVSRGNTAAFDWEPLG